MEKPDTVIAGRAYTSVIRVTNQGNSPANIALSVEGKDAARSHIEPAKLSLAAGQSATTTVVTASDGGTKHSYTQFVHIDATDYLSKERLAEAVISVKILPYAQDRRAQFHSLPTEVIVGVSGGAHSSAATAAWTGTGTLNESGSAAVDFLIQRAETSGINLTGWRNESRLDYQTVDTRLRLGDQAYGLSYLTDYYHYGRGIAVDVGESRPTGVGGYYTVGRWDEAGERMSALYVSRRVTRKLQLKLNLLNSRRYSYVERALVDGRVWSAEALLRLARNVSLRAEYGRSVETGGGGKGSAAYRLELAGSTGGIHYSALKTHAAPDFLGYYRDSDYESGTLSLPLGAAATANVAFSSWSQNLELRPYQTTAPRESLVESSIRHNLPHGWFAALGADHFRRTDDLTLNTSDIIEDPLTAMVGRSAARSSWSLQYRQGQSIDRSLHTNAEVRDLKLFASLRPSSDKFVTVYGGRRSGGRSGYLLSGRDFFGASMDWKASQALRLNAWVTQYPGTDGAATDRVAEMSVQYDLPSSNSIAVRVFSESQSFGRGVSYVATYTHPLDVPVSRRSSVGGVEGSIYETLSSGRVAIPNVVFNLNDEAVVSDRRGRFSFPAIPPGHYTVTMDAKTLGKGRSTVVRMPVTVDVKGGKTTRLDVAVAASAYFGGRVALVPATEEAGSQKPSKSGDVFVVGGPDNAVGEEHGLANIVVEMRNGAETLRRSTDGDGGFIFEDLREGVWHLKVYQDNVPAYYAVEMPEQDVTVNQLHPINIAIQVRPRRRHVEMLEMQHTPPAVSTIH